MELPSSSGACPVFVIPLVLSLASAAPAQQPRVLPAPGPVRDVGTFHVATGTWTRRAQPSAISPDAINRNDVSFGYLGVGWEGCWTVDEIMLPGPTSPKAGPQVVGWLPRPAE